MKFYSNVVFTYTEICTESTNPPFLVFGTSFYLKCFTINFGFTFKGIISEHFSLKLKKYSFEEKILWSELCSMLGSLSLCFSPAPYFFLSLMLFMNSLSWFFNLPEDCVACKFGLPQNNKNLWKISSTKQRCRSGF